MPRPNAFVSSVVDPSIRERVRPVIGGTGAGPVRVVLLFANGRRAWFDARSPGARRFARVLESLQEDGLPAYVEVSADDELLRVLVPRTVRVVSLERRPSGDVVVHLSPSHAVHVLRASNPRFDELLRNLDQALRSGTAVAVTETTTRNGIEDVTRLDQPPFEHALAAGPEVGTFTKVTLKKARQMFTHLEATSCSVSEVSSPCIPFLYPDDGCHARAHMMCEILLNDFGIESGKIWLYEKPGETYVVDTPNHPDCSVEWLYHVATVVKTPSGLRVIDPSLFDHLVTAHTWRTKQFPNGEQVITDRTVFDHLRPDASIETDDSMQKTKTVLGEFRAKLIDRIEDLGAPPYCA